jgi:hypothetical protein
MKNIHTAQITIGSHDQIMIGDYPTPQRGADEIQELARLWHEDMADIPDEQFCRAVQDHRKHSQWWPTVSEIIARYEERRRADLRQRQFLPEATHHLSDEERRQNQERVRALIQKIDAGNEAGR